MSWERIDLSTLEADIHKLLAAALDPRARPSPSALRETALALLTRARTLPALAASNDADLPQTGWIGTRCSGDGWTEVSFWKEEADALFQAQWEGKTARALLVQIDGRMWMSDPVHRQGWSYDPRRALDVIDNAQELAEIRTAAQEVTTAWEREHHPRSGWRCANCGWQNHASELTCALCLTPQQPVHLNPLTEWKDRALVPPPPFDQSAPGNLKPGEAVELSLPVPVQDMLNDVVEGVTEQAVDRVKGKARGKLLDAANETKPAPLRCWRCKTKLRKQPRICPRCGADQEAAPDGDRPARPTNLPE